MNFKLISSILGVAAALVVVFLMKIVVDSRYLSNTTHISSLSDSLSATPTTEAQKGDGTNNIYLPLVEGNTDVQALEEWNVLHNKQWGYTIRYPLSFTIIDWSEHNDFSNSEYAHLITFYSDKTKDQFQSPEIGLVIYKNQSKKGLSEWFADRYSAESGITSSSAIQQSNVSASERIYINGQLALKYIEEDPVTPSIIISKNDTIIKLYYTNAYSEDEDISGIFNAMINTFQIE